MNLLKKLRDWWKGGLWKISFALLLFLWYVLVYLTLFSESYGLIYHDLSIASTHTTFQLVTGLCLIVGVVTMVIIFVSPQRPIVDLEVNPVVSLLLIGPQFIGCFWLPIISESCRIVIAGIVMVVSPIYWFIKSVPHTLKKGVVVGYFVSFFAWIVAIVVGIVGDLFAILGVCMFLGIGVVGLTYIMIRSEMKKRKEKRKEAVARELEDQLTELKEQLGRGVITQEEYEQKKKKLLEKSET